MTKEAAPGRGNPAHCLIDFTITAVHRLRRGIAAATALRPSALPAFRIAGGILLYYIASR